MKLVNFLGEIDFMCYTRYACDKCYYEGSDPCPDHYANASTECMYLIESQVAETGYMDRFELIKTLTIIKGTVTLQLTGEECRRLYQHLKPPI